MNKYWIPGPITNYGTTVAGFKGEVRVVEAAEFDRYAHANKVQAEEIRELRVRLAGAEREHKLLDEAHILICQAIAAGNMGDDTPIQTRYAMRQWLEKFANSTADSAEAVPCKLTECPEPHWCKTEGECLADKFNP